MTAYRIILTGLCVSLLAGPAWADDFDRPGWYVGAGGGVAWDFLSEFAESETMGIVEIGVTGTVNVRGGYRVWSWFAVEAMYEGAYDFETKVAGVPVSNFSTHSLLANLKLIIPSWRIQPYFAPGVGAQNGQFEAEGILAAFDTNRWDLVLRFGLGIDFYATKHWLLNLELAPSIRFTDYGDIGSKSTDNVNLTLSGGIQYRF